MKEIVLVIVIFMTILLTIVNLAKAHYRESISSVSFILQSACITYIIYLVLVSRG